MSQATRSQKKRKASGSADSDDDMSEDIANVLKEIGDLQLMCAETNKIVSKLQSTVEKMLAENKKTNSLLAVNNDKSVGLVALAEKSNAVLSDMNKCISGSNSNARISYSAAVKSKPVIVVKPKDVTQTCSTTKTDMRKKIDPCGLSICDIRNVSKGGIVIECASKDASIALQSDVAAKLGESYIVNIPGKRLPKIRVTGISEQFTLDELKTKIMDQNPDIISKESTLNIVHSFKTKYSFGIKIETDQSTFNKIMELKKLRIDWDICSVCEAFDLMRCYKCSGFHHTAKNCTSKLCCPRCTGDHLVVDCTSTAETCINCKQANINLKLSIDTSHSAWSFNCPVYIRKINIEKRSVEYGSD